MTEAQVSERDCADVGDVTTYGFTWGPITVTRMALLPDGRHVLGIDTNGSPALEIYVSRTGKSVRAFRGGRELQ